MRRLVFCLVVTIASISFIASCAPDKTSVVSPSPTTTPSSQNTTPSSTTPSPSPVFVASGDEISSLVNGNSAFTFDLYQKLKGTKDGNFFYSPYSISAALAMTYAGARGNTAQQMEDTLHFALDQERLHSSFNTLDQELKQRGKDLEMYVLNPDGEMVQEKVDGFRLNIVNAFWGQKGYNFLPEYLDMIKQYYGGEINTLDFAKEPEPSRLEINRWASEKTEGRIKDVLPTGSIKPLTRFILANAIYFKARWEYQFAPSLTKADTFYLTDGNKVTVPLMHQKGQRSYAEDNAYQALRLPYLGGELGMVVLLPREGQFENFEDSLDAQKLNSIIGKLEPREVNVTLPKFTFESNYNLVQTLPEMGMTDAFSPGTADFSGMTGNKEIYIGLAIHKTFIAVDEVGTEAAAVTVISGFGAAPPPVPVDFTANRPFIFLIQDIKTGTILFIGRVLNPAE
jgi:serpin B